MPSRMYEYPLPRVVDEMQLHVPTGSIPRSVGVGSGNKPKIWVEVPQGIGAGAGVIVLNIRTILSYNPIPDNYRYIGSYSLAGSAYHVYGTEGVKEADKVEVIPGSPAEKPPARHRR